MKKIYPKKLVAGDEIRVVAPSLSISIISKQNCVAANARLERLGFKVTFSKNVNESDEFSSSSIKSRVADLHRAFLDKKVKMVLTVIGGFNCNQLLRYIDWNIIKENPKIFMGFSDTTALQNSIFAKTGLITYSGPSWSTFAQEKDFDYTLDSFKKCLMNNEPYDVEASKRWSDDKWYRDQNAREFNDNAGWLIINKGRAIGTILGANLCTFNLLQGTEFMPNLKDSILFIEDDSESKIENFSRDLQSLVHQPAFKGVKGIVIGRFQKASEVTNEKLIKVIKTIFELKNIPVIANVDFGHTSPLLTFPIGGEAEIDANKKKIRVLKH